MPNGSAASAAILSASILSVDKLKKACCSVDPIGRIHRSSFSKYVSTSFQFIDEIRIGIHFRQMFKNRNFPGNATTETHTCTWYLLNRRTRELWKLFCQC